MTNVLTPTLSLSSSETTKDEVVLTSSTTWARLRAEGGYLELGLRTAMAMLENLRQRRAWAVRRFTAEAHLGARALDRLDDQQVLALLRNGLRDGRLVALRKAGGNPAQESATAELRRLTKQIDRETRGKLSYQGRQYKLVVGDDLAKTPGRDAYEVVGQGHARAVLEGMARESGIELLRLASGKLSQDWRPPVSQPDGLVLLRRIPVQASARVDEGPALTPSQMKALLDKAKLDIHVVDLAGVPQRGLAYKIKLPDGGLAQGELDNDGRASAQSSVPGIFTVRFPDLDGADWDGDGALELAPATERGRAGSHQVQQGDRLPTIARQQGFLRWETVWDFSGNAELRKLRGSPFVLSAGDEVAVPSKLERVAEVPGGEAEYVVQSAPETLCVRFAEAEAMGATVLFRATPDAGDDAFEGELAEDGTMEVELPPDAKKVVVELFCGDGDDPFVTYELAVGELDPASQPTGVQMRLANLGYYGGKIDGDVGEVTKAAIVRFRREYGLSLSDAIDDELREALRWVHDDDDDTDECEADQTIPDDGDQGDATADAVGDNFDHDEDKEEDEDLPADDLVSAEDQEDEDFEPVEWEDDSGDDEDEDDDADEVTS